jgi:3-oxoacyl-[acyl-carrier protein] reductase
MDLGLSGKVALVTGAGSQKGFGKSIALTLAREGCDIIAADINLEGAKQTVAEIETLGRKALAVNADIAKIDQVNDMVKAAMARFDRIDILVNNAGGLFSLKLFHEKPEAEIDNEINLNYRGAMNCVRAVMGQMMARKSGKIVNIASIGATKGMAHTVVYNSAKAGIVQFTRCLAVELGPLGINVNCISPGLGLTNFGGGGPPPDGVKAAIARIPARRTTTPQDIANAVLFLVSDISTDVMGQNLGVDGGENII